MSNTDGTCEYVLDPDDPETWGGEEGEECYVDEEVLNEDGVWTCPHDAKEGENLCIFHIPLEKKDEKKVLNTFVNLLASESEKSEIKRNRTQQFLGATFGDVFPIDESLRVKGELRLSYADIEGRIDLSDIVFEEKIFFIHTEFVANTYFERTCFEADIDFSHSTFKADVDFSSAKFEADTSFFQATFEKEVNFRNAKFEESTSFLNSTFKSEPSFYESSFEDDVQFSATFEAGADFGSAQFASDASFNSAGFGTDSGRFEASVSFISTTFNAEASFERSLFQNIVYFWNTTFEADVDFSHATFEADAEFNDGIIGGDGATFEADADFRQATFEAEQPFESDNDDNTSNTDANFTEAEFKRQVTFQGLALNSSQFTRADLTDAKFNEVNLYKAEFESTLLSRATLFGADLRGAKLNGAVLGDVRIDEDTKFLGHPSDDSDSSPHTFSTIRSQQTCVYDPDYEEDNEHADVEKAKSVYRALEELGGKHARPRLQARSFVRRQDLQKDEYKQDAKEAESWEERLIAGARWSRARVARATLLYGESPWRVIAWSLGIILSFALLYPLGGWMRAEGANEPLSYSQIPVSLLSEPIGWLGGFLNILGDSLYYSTLTYTALGFGDFQPEGFGRLLTTLETGFGAVMLALLVFILGRRAAR